METANTVKLLKIEPLPNGGERRFWSNGTETVMDKEAIRFERRMKKETRNRWHMKKFVSLQTGRG